MFVNCYCISLQFADIKSETLKWSILRIIFFLGQCDCCSKQYCCYSCAKEAIEEEEMIASQLELENKISYTPSVSHVHDILPKRLSMMPHISTQSTHETIDEGKEIDIFQERERVGTLSLSLAHPSSDRDGNGIEMFEPEIVNNYTLNDVNGEIIINELDNENGGNATDTEIEIVYDTDDPEL